MYVALSILFLIFLIFFIIYGWGIIMRRSGENEKAGSEKCSLCREQFSKESMVERQIGDFKIMYFCAACIESLNDDAKRLHRYDHQ